ncbi:MAG: DUF362 domain-containing protein, partial [Gemmatimonadales bacterium]
MTIEPSSGQAGFQAPTREPRVAVIHTNAATVIDDVGRVMELAGYQQHLPADRDTLLKVNISWQHYYPGCSTSPWQLDGVATKLEQSGYGNIIPVQNGTVVVDSHEGERGNKHDRVFAAHGLKPVHLQDRGARWVPYAPRGEMLVLDKIFPDGIEIPEVFLGRNIVHLPTLKTHVFTTMTGAMKNA